MAALGRKCAAFVVVIAARLSQYFVKEIPETSMSNRNASQPGAAWAGFGVTLTNW